MEGVGREPGLEGSRPVESFVETVRWVTLEPAWFFRRVTNRERVWPPTVFFMVCGLVSVILGAAVNPLLPVGSGPFGGTGGGLLGGFPAPDNGIALAAAVFAAIVLAPLIAIIGAFAGALIYQALVWLIVGRANSGFWVTFKIYAYTSVVALLSWLPFVGVLATVYGYYLVFVGMREGHSTTPVRAAGVAAVPFLFFLGSSVIGVVTAAA